MHTVEHLPVLKAHAHLRALSKDALVRRQASIHERVLQGDEIGPEEKGAMTAEALAETNGLSRGIGLGVEEGIRLGQARILRRQLQKKFGVISDFVKKKLHHADSTQLEQWAEDVLVADEIKQVFGPEADD